MLKRIIFVLFLFSILLANQVFASGGSINADHHYAWGENVGWVDFINANVTDTSLEGSAYGENIGWIDLSTVTNNKGTLGGYAWGENVGWVDFSPASITDGVFTGGAYGENIGWIVFGTGDNKVMTDWRPAVRHGSTGSSSSSMSSEQLDQIFNLPPTPPLPNPLPEPNSDVQHPNSPSCIITHTLKLKSPYKTEVQCAQDKLNFFEIIKLSVDGNFGPKTKASVIKFQIANHLTPDGIVGPVTRDLLLK